MDINNEYLQKFVGGLLYFRWVCFETGPDWYYLFRHKIISIRLTPNGELVFLGEDPPLNRFSVGEWVNHPTQKGERVFKRNTHYEKGKGVNLPLFTSVSPTILHVKIDAVADGVFYADPQEEPEPVGCFKYFPRGYESLANLGGLPL